MAAAVLGLVALVALAESVLYLFVGVMSPPGIGLDGATEDGLYRVDTPPVVSVEGWDSRIIELDLRQVQQSQPMSEGWPSVQVVPRVVGHESFPPKLVAQVALPDGSSPLRPDSTYQLRVKAAVLQVGFPLPKQTIITEDFTFSTVPSPRPILGDGRIDLRYGEDVVVRWNAGLTSFEYALDPPAPSEGRIDPTDHRTVRISLRGYEPGRLYRLTFTRALAENGAWMEQPADTVFRTPVTPMVLQPEEPLVALPGEALPVHFNIPMETFTTRVSPDTAVTSWLDEKDRSLGYVLLQHPEQGRRYELVITEGVAANGAPLNQPFVLEAHTPAPLEITAHSPEDGEDELATRTKIWVAFDRPVSDREAAERAFSLRPAVNGRFQWEDDQTMLFVPEEAFPARSPVIVRVVGGLDGPRGQDGSYVESDLVFSFTTGPDKRLDVDLSRQTLALIEDGQVINVLPVATGVRGAETPTGEFQVQYKMRTARFRGVNPDGSRYDIPNVPWVLAFLGDYTIHGAPWRSVFGRPGSNGCVSLTEANARIVYEWAPVGTPITIHY